MQSVIKCNYLLNVIKVTVISQWLIVIMLIRPYLLNTTISQHMIFVIIWLMLSVSFGPYIKWQVVLSTTNVKSLVNEQHQI